KMNKLLSYVFKGSSRSVGSHRPESAALNPSGDAAMAGKAATRDPSEWSTKWLDRGRPSLDAPVPEDSGDRIGELAELFLARHRGGEQPEVEDDAAAYPELASEIRRLFPALLLMEELKPAVADDVMTSAPGRLGDYQILRELGRGGM